MVLGMAFLTDIQHTANKAKDNALAVGEWAEWTVTMEGEYDYVKFYFVAEMTIYIESIVVVPAVAE